MPDNSELIENASRIKRGEAVWVQRNTDASFGRTEDFFFGGLLRGFIDEDDQAADSYVYMPVDGNPEATVATRINETPLEYKAAVALVERTVVITSPEA